MIKGHQLFTYVTLYACASILFKYINSHTNDVLMVIYWSFSFP